MGSWGPSPLPKKAAEPPIFGPCLLWPNAWLDQDDTGTEVGLGPGHIVLDGDPARLPKKRAEPHNFWPICVVAKWLDRLRCHLVSSRPRPRRLCVRWAHGDPAPSPKRRRSPQFSAHVYSGQTARWIKMAHGTEVGLSPGHIVLVGDPAPPSPQFSADVRCDQMTGWTKMHLVWR